MKKNNFHYIDVLLHQYYGVEMELEDIEELGLIAWELIGNKDIKLYSYVACPSANNSVTLPCNAVKIEAVTTFYEDWNRVTNHTNFGDINSAFIENNIEAQKIFKNPFYSSGKLVPYEQVGDTLYFNENYGKLNILYKGIFMDEEELPYLSDKETLAIATYLAYIDKYKDGLKTNNTASINISQSLENKWLKLCDLARVIPLSQNDMNLILLIKNSYDRPNYGMSYKPIRK